MPNIFISYSNKDRDFVVRLAQDLNGQLPDVQVWYDLLLPAGASWADTLSEQIEKADIILAVLSPDYLVSEWASQELNVALLRRTQGKAKLIPILLRPCSPSGFLAKLNWLDFTGDYENAFASLLWGITGEKPRTAKGLEPGAPVGSIDPDEVAKLRGELREAVELFKSRTTPEIKIESKPPEERRPERKQRCFIVMPFGDADLQVVYEDFVKPTLEQVSVECERGDDVFGSNVIMDDILKSIESADLVLADLSRRNANVFYEVGICHALHKPVLLLAQSIDDVPFDLRHRRVLLYEYSARGCKRLEKALPDNIHALLPTGHTDEA